MVKRSFDLFFSLTGFLLLSPVFMCISCLVAISSSGPVFFRQSRVGLRGDLFRIHKFRTMYVDSEGKGLLTVGRDERVTPIGHFLRKYKLDELPQLIDVVLGKMSLVGPRPEVEKFINEYSEEDRQKILSVRPGITDNASIEMIDENLILAKYDDPHTAYIEHVMPIKKEYYLSYVDNQSTWNDFILIFKTIKTIMHRK